MGSYSSNERRRTGYIDQMDQRFNGPIHPDIRPILCKATIGQFPADDAVSGSIPTDVVH